MITATGRPPHLPFTDPHTARAPGLFALPPRDWVEICDGFTVQMALRDRLIAAHEREVADALPEAEPAVRELTAALAAHLPARFPGLYRREATGLRRPDGVRVPLDGGIAGLGRLCQEDWLVLQAATKGGYRLTAGNLCFPAYWRLADKLGQPLTEVHAPVPGYAERLAPRVDRILAALHPDRPLQRLNWSLAASPRLDTPRRDATGPARYLRVERQTLRRLPRTGAVVFTVKTYINPLSEVPAEARPALDAAIRALSADHAAYKGGEAFLRSALSGAEGVASRPDLC